MNYYNIHIRVCKSIIWLQSWDWWSVTIIKDNIKAESKDEAKKIILNKYPQFFQNWKIYTRETKDEAQFFYVLIYEYWKYWIEEGMKEWECSYCWKIHENSIEYIKTKSNKFPWKSFCSSWSMGIWGEEKPDIPSCLEWYERDFYRNNNIEDNQYYINEKSKYFIYKITEKKSSKSYIWQTRNAPFFRWWQHLTHSSSPFWLYLRQTNLSDWIFEVLEELPPTLKYEEVLQVESKYIIENNSIENWYNSLISKKS